MSPLCFNLLNWYYPDVDQGQSISYLSEIIFVTVCVTSIIAKSPVNKPVPKLIDNYVEEALSHGQFDSL